MNKIYYKDSDFICNHVYLHPSNPFEDENTSLAYEDCKMKDNCEGDELTSSLSIGDRKIIAKDDDVVNGDKGNFISCPKEEDKSYLESSFELPNEVEDKPPQVGCELENLNEEIMQRDVHNSNTCVYLCHNEERFDMSEHPILIITIVEIYEPTILVGGKT